MTTYSDKLKSPKWQKKRLEILNRDNFKCVNCGDDESQLQIHHLIYSNDICNVDNDKLITLCENCHKEFSETNIEIKVQLSFIKDIDLLCEVLNFLKIASKTNPFDVSSSVKYLEFIKDSDYKTILSLDSFFNKYKELKNEQ